MQVSFRQRVLDLLNKEYKLHLSYLQEPEDARDNAAYCVQTEVSAIIDEWQEMGTN